MMDLQKLIDGLKAHKSGAASYESVDEAIRVFEAMRDVDGEKVCKGLNCHINGDPHTRCHKCPYWGTGPHGSSECNVLAADALALIRQQQERIAELEAAQIARVMTPEEVAAVPDGSVIWEEIKSTGICEAMIRDSNLFVNGPDFLALDDVLDCDDYLKNYRCWTQRPTDEQRKAVKWE